jgi:ERCC4-type nuclease
MTHLTILRDTREQKPWEFDEFDVTLEDVTLKTGDYTLAEFCDVDENDTYHPVYAVERKSGSDFLQSIGKSRKRFEAEIKRAEDWSCPLKVIIEEPKEPSRYKDDYFMRFSDMSRSSILGTVDSWERYYNVKFVFAGNRGRAQQKAHSALLAQLRAHLVSD